MIEVQIGDSRKLIHGLKDKSIDCVVTSPPYWGLRDYKTEPIIFDGLPDCEHDFSIETEAGDLRFRGANAAVGYNKNPDVNNGNGKGYFCQNCGAWRGQLGLEPTPELFIKHLLDFFDDVKLKLKDEGNCFVNLGDSYSGSQPKKPGDTDKSIIKAHREVEASFRGTILNFPPAKCLCMIPQRFAWGMIERNWILRNSIIWAKPNHMPESVTDRLTKAHEVIYHFVKQGKYYYNLDAIREPDKVCGVTDKRPLGIERSRDYEGKWQGNNMSETFSSPRARTQRKAAEYKGKWEDDQQYMNNIQVRINEARANGVSHGSALNHPKGKNPGDVWYIPTAPYPESHFATFPLKLVRRPILAGCPVGGTVLDPFAGSGTVGEFCRNNERNAILFELNPDYKRLIEDRAMLLVPELSSWCSSKGDA